MEPISDSGIESESDSVHVPLWYLYTDRTQTKTKTDKRMGCIGLCGVVHAAQRQIATQIPIGSHVFFLGLGQCVRTVIECKEIANLNTHIAIFKLIFAKVTFLLIYSNGWKY